MWCGQDNDGRTGRNTNLLEVKKKIGTYLVRRLVRLDGEDGSVKQGGAFWYRHVVLIEKELQDVGVEGCPAFVDADRRQGEPVRVVVLRRL